MDDERPALFGIGHAFGLRKAVFRRSAPSPLDGKPVPRQQLSIPFDCGESI
jgi:hypothetical protein